MAHGSRLVAQGSWLMAKKNWREPRAWRHEPWAMKHQPLIIDYLMSYPIIYSRYDALGIIQEYRFPPLHHPPSSGTRADLECSIKWQALRSSTWLYGTNWSRIQRHLFWCKLLFVFWGFSGSFQGLPECFLHKDWIHLINHPQFQKWNRRVDPKR